MSENFFEKFKKYGILIAWFAVISIIIYFVKPNDLYWHKDIMNNKDFIDKTNIHFVISIILGIIAVLKIYKTLKEEYKDNPKERIDFIFYSIIISTILVIVFTFEIINFIADTRLLVNKHFEKGVIYEKYRIFSKTNEYLDIYNESKNLMEFVNIEDSTKYKNITLKDSVAVIKSKIGLFKIPYDHQIVEIK